MNKDQIITSCKLACRISSDTLNSEFSELIDAAYLDLEESGIADETGAPYAPANSDQLIITAVKTFVKLHMGDLLDNNEASRLEESYWSQKALLKMRNHSSSNLTEDPEDDSDS